MQSHSLAIFGLIFLAGTYGGSAAADIREAWKSSPGRLAAALEVGEGFSFHYAEKPMGPVLADGWKQSTSVDSATGITQRVFTHASGLEITRRMRVFPQANAVEYQLSLKNTSRAPLPVISALDALSLSLKGAVTQDTCVVSSSGGMIDYFLPPRSFAIQKRCFPPTVPEAGWIRLKPDGGRSSNGDLPFFFIHNEAHQEGLFVAFGWSGQWEVIIGRNQNLGAFEWGAPLERVLRVSGRIPDLEVALEPGETITGPTILVGLYQGALAEGSNQLRRLIREVYTPRIEAPLNGPWRQHRAGGRCRVWRSACVVRLLDPSPSASELA